MISVGAPPSVFEGGFLSILSTFVHAGTEAIKKRAGQSGTPLVGQRKRLLVWSSSTVSSGGQTMPLEGDARHDQ
jgi:hypothetical protein